MLNDWGVAHEYADILFIFATKMKIMYFIIIKFENEIRLDYLWFLMKLKTALVGMINQFWIRKFIRYGNSWIMKGDWEWVEDF